MFLLKEKLLKKAHNFDEKHVLYLDSTGSRKTYFFSFKGKIVFNNKEEITKLRSF